MSHETLKNLVFELHDGALAPAERAEAERHLAGCAECRAALEEWKRTAAVFFQPAAAEPSEAFVGRVMARISDVPAGLWERFRSALTPPRLVFAGAAALALVAALSPLRRPDFTDPDAGVRHAVELLENPVVFASAEDPGPEETVEEYFL